MEMCTVSGAIWLVTEHGCICLIEGHNNLRWHGSRMFHYTGTTAGPMESFDTFAKSCTHLPTILGQISLQCPESSFSVARSNITLSQPRVARQTRHRPAHSKHWQTCAVLFRDTTSVEYLSLAFKDAKMQWYQVYRAIKIHTCSIL